MGVHATAVTEACPLVSSACVQWPAVTAVVLTPGFVVPFVLVYCVIELTLLHYLHVIIYSCSTQYITDSSYDLFPLTLPYLTFGAGAQRTPALRPQFGPIVQPRQTSWLKNSPRGFCKPQENCPVDTIKSVQWERVITEERSSEQHCGTALSNEMNRSFLLILAEGTYRFVSETHNFEMSISSYPRDNHQFIGAVMLYNVSQNKTPT